MLDSIYHAIDPVIFAWGPIAVRWYGLAYLLGFVCAALVIWRVSQHWRIAMDSDSLLTVLLCVVVGVILGARIGYVLVYGDGNYFRHPEEILAFNHGGMSFHGGLIGAILGAVVASRMTSVPFLTLADLGCIGTPIGLFFGRCANFINGELWGAPCDLPWAVVFGGAAGNIPRHPSQLYEALLEGALLFIVLFALSRKVPPRPRGTFFGVFLVGYGCCRFLVEFVRLPDVQLGYLWGGWLTMGQLLSMPLVVCGIALIVYSQVKRPIQLGVPYEVLYARQGYAAEEGTEGQAAVPVEDAEVQAAAFVEGVEMKGERGSGATSDALPVEDEQG